MAAPESPVPPPPLVALGIILEAPFVPQLIAPLLMNTHLTSTLLDEPADSVTTFVSAGPGVLLSSMYVAGAAEKKVDHHYTPPDVKELIASLKEKRAKIAEAREATTDLSQRAEYDSALADLDQTLAKLKAGQAPAPALARSTFHETSGEPITISGETIYDYDALNICKATTTTRNTESPPVILVAEKEFEYNLLGRMTQMIQYETATTYAYDPGGRVLSSTGEFSSPEGDFTVSHRTNFMYAPPQGAGPIGGNAVMSSLCESKSGPGDAMQREREKPDPAPAGDLNPGPNNPAAPRPDQLQIPRKDGLAAFRGLDPSTPETNSTTSLSTYVYP